MTTATQQLPSSPAQRLADKIRARTNNGRDLIDLLHNIAQGGYYASKSDRITASKFLFERGFGKCPRQTPATTPTPEPRDNNVGALREAPPAKSESPRLVTQVQDALNDSLGPAPGTTRLTPLSTNHYPIQSSIQDYILEITSDGETLVDSLMEIAYADDDDSTVTPHLRSRADRILIDRLIGTDPNTLRSAVCPDCRRKWTNHTDSSDHTEHKPSMVEKVDDPRSDEERLAAIEADLNKMIDKGILTPDPNASPIDISAYRMPKDFDITPYAAEEAAAFKAEIELRIERQKQWPEIEERRRKKLEQIYPSHSDDGDPPDT